MNKAGATHEQFLRTVVLWSLAYWAAIYALLTTRSLVLRPDLPILSLASLRVLMIPPGLIVCALLSVVLERISKFQGARKAAALALAVTLGTVLYFTLNYYVFHRFTENGMAAPNAVMKIVSYLIEFFWIFPAWMLLYMFLRWRLGAARAVSAPSAPCGLWVKSRGSQILIGHELILWIDAERDYARIHTSQGSYLVRSTMTALERQLLPFGFVRIHRRVIAPTPAIRALSQSRDGSSTVTLANGKTLPAGRAYLPRLKKVLAMRPNGSSKQA